MKKRIGIIGASGFIGKALKRKLADFEIKEISGHSLYQSPNEIKKFIEGLDIIINVAGHSINGRWTKKRKQLIYDSRVLLTENLVNAIKLLDKKPYQLINASAIGIYKDGSLCNEESTDFAQNELAELVKEWEKSAYKVTDAGVKLSIMRFGIVLSQNGGAYKNLRRISNFFMVKRIGNGNQGFSYVLLDDVTAAVEFIITKGIEGIINIVSPEPVDNKIFLKTVANKLKRPALLIIPGFLIKALFAEGSTILLEGQKVSPGKLLENDFRFIGNNLNNCLDSLEK